MGLNNPNDHHWVFGNGIEWTREFLDALKGEAAESSDGASARLDSVREVVDDSMSVGQRKRKPQVLFDLVFAVDFSGKLKDSEDEARGEIKVTDVCNHVDGDDYAADAQFEVKLFAEKSENEPIKQLVRDQLVPRIRARVGKLQQHLVDQVWENLTEGKGAAAQAPEPTPKASTAPTASGTHTAPAEGTGPSVNVTTLNASAEFRTSADELFKTFTDEQRLSAFTRGPVRPFSGTAPGAEFGLFDGNVTGSFVSTTAPTKIVQRWRLASWPKGHHSTITINFNQNDEDHVTVMNVEWDGVPVGRETETSTNWERYYVHSIKTTFGFGTVL